jgi:hypothetical protein
LEGNSTFVQLNDPPDAKGLRWIDFGPTLEPKEVIIGAQCSPAISKTVADTLKPYGDSVKYSWAGMRPDAFLLALPLAPHSLQTNRRLRFHDLAQTSAAIGFDFGVLDEGRPFKQRKHANGADIRPFS